MFELDMPVHPTKRHPLTGEPLKAIYVRKDGRVCWPIIGAADDADKDKGGGGDTDDDKDKDKGSGSAGGGGGDAGASSNATDAQGNDLGYPKDTPTAEMTDKQQTAYWKHNSRRHESRLKDIVGDRAPEDLKKDLEAYAELKKAQQTPAEQALTERFDQGKAEGIATERKASATAIFRGALESGGVTGDDLEDLVVGFNVDTFVTDKGIDTTKITNFAKKFSTSGKDTQQQRQRDFGGGRRQEGQPARGSGGKAEAERRFKKTTAGQ